MPVRSSISKARISPALLAAMDLGPRAKFLPAKVSGGERQRAAVARALVRRGRSVVLTDDGDRVDCARLGKGGYSVPSIVEPDFIQIRRCTADFVLLVEKGTQGEEQ